MSRSLRFGLFAAVALTCTLVLRAADRVSSGDAELQFQLGSLLFDETRYWEALQAFDKATQTDDPALALRARKGRVRTALRVAEVGLARKEAEFLRQTASSAVVRPITYTLSAGVGEVGLRGLQLGRLDTLEIGTLKLSNVPTLI